MPLGTQRPIDNIYSGVAIYRYDYALRRKPKCTQRAAASACSSESNKALKVTAPRAGVKSSQTHFFYKTKTNNAPSSSPPWSSPKTPTNGTNSQSSVGTATNAPVKTSTTIPQTHRRRERIMRPFISISIVRFYKVKVSKTTQPPKTTT
jgi:hypothetical protein